MKEHRLPALLVIMGALLGLRWFYPPKSELDAPLLAEAVNRRAGDQLLEPKQAPSVVMDTPGQWAAGTREPDDAEPRNAFAPRLPPPPPKPPPAPPVLMGPQVPPAPPPPAPPPLQVIGRWVDEAGPSLFVATPRGVLQAREGSLLMNEFRVERIAPQQLLIKQLRTNRDIALPLPAAPSTQP